MVWGFEEVERDFPDSARNELIGGFRNFMFRECNFVGGVFYGQGVGSRTNTQLIWVEYQKNNAPPHTKASKFFEL